MSKKGGQVGNSNAQRHGVYSKHFTADEIDRILSPIVEQDDGIKAMIEASGVLLDRIIGRMSVAGNDEFVEFVKAHNETTGRIAALLRQKNLASGSNGLGEQIAGLLDELSTNLNVKL